MKNIKIGPTRFNGGVYGATGPGPIWQMAMSAAVDGTPKTNFQTVNIPDPLPKTDPNASPTPPAGGDAAGANAGLIGGNFTLPPGIIGGNGNGGNGGNGGGRH
ncbi:hypothetical protein ACFQ0T_22000 [Kitasatospora gansuensis]